MAQNLFSKEPRAAEASRCVNPFASATARKVPDHTFYASYRYWYKCAFFAQQTLDGLVFSEVSSAESFRPKFGISVCFQLFWG